MNDARTSGLFRSIVGPVLILRITPTFRLSWMAPSSSPCTLTCSLRALSLSLLMASAPLVLWCASTTAPSSSRLSSDPSPAFRAYETQTVGAHIKMMMPCAVLEGTSHPSCCDPLREDGKNEQKRKKKKQGEEHQTTGKCTIPSHAHQPPGARRAFFFCRPAQATTMSLAGREARPEPLQPQAATRSRTSFAAGNVTTARSTAPRDLTSFTVSFAESLPAISSASVAVALGAAVIVVAEEGEPPAPAASTAASAAATASRACPTYVESCRKLSESPSYVCKIDVVCGGVSSRAANATHQVLPRRRLAPGENPPVPQ